MTAATAIDVGAALARQEAMLERQRRGLGQICARGVPGAWDVLVAIYGEPVPQSLRGKAVPR